MSTDKKIRLKTALKARYPDWSHSYLQKLIAAGRVFVNQRPASPHDWVNPGADVHVDATGLPFRLAANAAVDCRLLNISDDYIFLVKGPFVHSVAQDVEETNSVANWLLSLDAKLAELDPLECGLAHRLDFETSGVMVAGRNRAALTHLEQEFRSQRARKDYVCLVDDNPSVVGLHIASAGKHPKSAKRIAIQPIKTNSGAGQTEIRTEIRSVLPHDGGFLLRIRLITGYRHQIRAHLALLGAPIRGDKIYGGAPADRLFLHAEALEFCDANGGLQRGAATAPFV